jgi:hypothetical protein
MYEDRVERGAALLDEACPGWERQIDPRLLRMESCDRCILGQLYGHYVLGLSCVLEPQPGNVLFAASDCGFTLIAEEQDGYDRIEALERFHQLADAWRRLIRRRLADASPSVPAPAGAWGVTCR